MTWNENRILYEDNHLLIINKAPGELVQGDKTGDAPLGEALKEYIREKYGKPGQVFLGVVHRLDRPVSGAVIFARTSKALERMNELFREKKVQKIYWAAVKNRPPDESGSLIHYLVKDELKNKSKAFSKEVKGSSRAWLDYKVLATGDRYCLLEVVPHTGRHHQIRVQLASMGCPIKGDVKYGFDRTNDDGSIHLHARSISFVHPVQKKEIQLTAPVPEEKLWKYFEESVSN